MKEFVTFWCMLLSVPCLAGPYSYGYLDPQNQHDAPVPGFTGPHGDGAARLDDGSGEFVNPQNRVNPLFFAWADAWVDYHRSDSDLGFSDPDYALGPVTGENFDVVSLGDLTSASMAAGSSPGSITLRLGRPVLDMSGADFAVFENGFITDWDTGGIGVGGVWCELAYVEVSSDGVNFVRLPAVSLTTTPVGGYGSVDSTNVYNLAGKHVNAYGESWGTPFDIGQVGLREISHIRLVDIPGSGYFTDSLGNPIYDGWRTFGSGGFDLEAVGCISSTMYFAEWPMLEGLPTSARAPDADPDMDGICNLKEYAFGLDPTSKDAPSTGWESSVVKVDDATYIELSTLRDERLLDISREIQVSSDLVTWESIAVSERGAAFQAIGGHPLMITDLQAGNIRSVGVLRRDTIRDLDPVSSSQRRYYRLKLSRLP